MSRAIDAVQVLNDINSHRRPTPVSEFESGFNSGLNQAMWIIRHAPTLAPPNAPLTIDNKRGANNPLVDTGQLQKRITWKILPMTGGTL